MPDKKLTSEEIAANLEMVRYIPPWLDHVGMSQRRLAELMGKSEGQISKWLNGLNTMSAAQFKQIAAIIGISWAQLSGPPDQKIRSELFHRVAEVVGQLSEDNLRTLLNVADALRKNQ